MKAEEGRSEDRQLSEELEKLRKQAHKFHLAVSAAEQESGRCLSACDELSATARSLYEDSKRCVREFDGLEQHLYEGMELLEKLNRKTGGTPVENL